MLNLAGEQVFLRALESSDIDFLYQVENNTLKMPISMFMRPNS
jgi:diamine N-acetyltransferase